MDEMACPHAAPLVEIYGHPLWSVVSSFGFLSLAETQMGKKKQKLHSLILTWSLLLCDHVTGCQEGVICHLCTLDIPSHTWVEIAWPECKRSRNPLRCHLGCGLFLTPCPDEVQGHSECSVWYQPLRTITQHHTPYLKQAYAKLLTQKLAISQWFNTPGVMPLTFYSTCCFW